MSRRPKLALVAALLLSPVAAGCSASDLPDAQLARAPADGIQVDADPIRVLNVMVVAAEDASDGVLTMTVANRGDEPDRLTAVTVDGVDAEFAAPQRLPARGAVSFGAGPGPTIVVRGLNARPGEAVKVTLTFENLGALRFRTIVVSAEDEYASITPSPAATAPSQATPTASPDASPSPDATAEAPDTSPSPEAS